MLASMQVWGMASRLLCMLGYFGFHLVIVRSSVGPQYVMACSWTKRVKQIILNCSRLKMRKGFYQSEDQKLNIFMYLF